MSMMTMTVEEMEEKLYELFDQLNVEHFDGSLPRTDVCVGIPADAEGDLIGLARASWWRGMTWFTIYLDRWLVDTPAGSEEARWQVIETRCFMRWRTWP